MTTVNEGQSNVLLKDVLITDSLPASAANNSLLNPLSSSNKQNIGASSLMVDSKNQLAVEPDKPSVTTDLLKSNHAIAESSSKKSDDSLIVPDPLKSSLSGSVTSNTGLDTLSGSQSGAGVKDTLTGSSKDAPLIAIKDDTLTATDSLTNNQSAKEISPDKKAGNLVEKETKPETETTQNNLVAEQKDTKTQVAINADKVTGEKPVVTVADVSKDTNKQNSTVTTTEAVATSNLPKETTSPTVTNADKVTGEKPVATVADVSKDSNKQNSTATSGDNEKKVTDNTQVAAVETPKELSQTVPKSELVANNPFTSGKFIVDSTGQVGIDFLFDGGLYKGQLAIVSLQGIEKFVPGSPEFIKEVASRALSNSLKGHVVINDLSEGARFTGNLPEGNYNEGTYLGVKTFVMTPGEEFGVMLVPNGTVQELLNNPVVGGDKRPLFSMATANPAEGFYVGQIADVTGSGKTFAMEDMRVDLGSDRDYNDLVFQVRGATGTAVNLDTVINADKDWRKAYIGKALLAYAKPYVELKVEAVQEEKKPAKNTDSASLLDAPISENPSVSKEKATSPTNTESLSKTEVVTSDTTVTPVVKTENDQKPIANSIATPTQDMPASDKAVVVSEVKTEDGTLATPTQDIPASDKAVVVSEVKTEDEKRAIGNSIATSTQDMPASDQAVVSEVKTEDEKRAIGNSIATPTQDIPASDKAVVVSEVKTEDEKRAIVLTSTPNESEKTDAVTSSPTVIYPLKIKEEKEAIATPISTTTKDAAALDKTVTKSVETESQAIAPQPAPKNISTVETETKTNQPQPAVTISPKIDKKPAITTQDFGQDYQQIVHETKPTIYPQELSTVNQSIATDSKPVTAIPELAKPAISTNSQPAISIQEVAPITQLLPPNATSKIATNSQNKTNTEPTTSAQNIGSNPVITANLFQSTKASQPLVGIISTGFNAKNSDIDYSRITLGKDRIANDDNPLIQSGEGSEQGTHVLGLIAATQNNSKGIDGINNEAPIWLGRASGNNSWAESLIEFVDAVKKSGQPNAVVNISFELTQVDDSGKIVSRYELTEAEENALEYARKNHIVVVVPVGNNPQTISALGKASLQFDNIITVGASSDGQVTDYSGTGKGLDILTEGGTLKTPVRSTVGEGTGLMAGTSVAAAQVTGAISQVWAANSQLNYQQVIDIIKRTATDIALPNWDAKTGAGLLNMAAAVPLAKATEAKPLPPEATVQDVVSQINNLAPELDKVLEQFNNQLQQISANPDSALVEPKPEDEKQASQELDALIADLQKEIDDLQNDSFADVDGIASEYQFNAKDQPLIGIIDTGFAENNPDIDYSRIIKGRDYNDSDDNPLLPASDPKAEHGTKVLEVIGAKQNNDIGINGVNDDAPLWVGRAVGSGKWAQSLREFVDAVKVSKQPNAIVNLSFDLIDKDGNTRTKFTAEERAAIEYARDNKVLIVAAAGNQGVEGLSALGKASREFPNIITVGAADWNGNLADYSSYGAGIDLVAFGSTPESQASSNANSNEDLLKDLTPEERQAVEKAIKFNEAPTEDAKLTEAEEQLVLEATKKLGKALGDIKNPDSNSVASIPEIVGTSIAAAKVTGAASQVWAANPNLSFAQVKAILKATAVDLGTPGWDIQTGAGLLNLADAVAMAKSPPTGLDISDSILSSDYDVWSEEGASEQEARRRRGFFRRLFRGAKRIFQRVSGFVGKVVSFVNKVSSFIGKVKGFFSKVSGIFSTVKKVFSWIGKKFLVLPILGKVGVVLGGIALVGGAIAGLVAWFKKKKQPPAQPPVPNTTPPEITNLEGIWGGLPTALKTALKNGINSAYGQPLFQGDPAGILPLLQTVGSINPPLTSTSPQLYSWLLYGTPAQFLPVLQGTATTPVLPTDVANAWSALNAQQRQELLKFLQAGIPQLYQPLFNGTDPDGILPLFNALGGISTDAQNTVLGFLPGGIPSQYQSNFP